MSFIRVDINSPDSAQALADRLRASANRPGETLRFLGDYCQSIGQGTVPRSSVRIVTGAAQASGTVQFINLANNDTVTVNGRVYTAKTSGAAGLQQFNLGGSDINAAINFTTAINADTSPLIAGVVTATSSTSTTTITAVTPGLTGNSITLAISAHGTVSGALLGSGAETATTVLSL